MYIIIIIIIIKLKSLPQCHSYVPRELNHVSLELFTSWVGFDDEFDVFF